MDELKDIARQAKESLPVFNIEEIKYVKEANLIFMSFSGGQVSSFQAENVKDICGGLK